jgi:hypothetical protein
MLGAMALAPVAAFAVDGQVLINQSTLSAAGGTYTIMQPGSYKLSGNLVAKDENTNVIVIAADHVTIDLNGFAILGPTDCAGGLSPCARSGLGAGISTDPFKLNFNVTIRNGTIQGMGAEGILLFGDSNLVEHMHVRSNGHGGILVVSSNDRGGSIVQYNTAERNGSDGIRVDAGSVHHNVVSVNLFGISVSTGTISDNLVNRNAGYSLAMGQSASYKGNVLQGNGQNIIGGVNQGQNLCDNAACPGAVF